MNDTLAKNRSASTSAGQACDNRRPTCCGECPRFIRDNANPGFGRCGDWAGVEVSDTCRCHPLFGMLLSRRAPTPA